MWGLAQAQLALDSLQLIGPTELLDHVGVEHLEGGVDLVFPRLQYYC